MLHKSLFYVCKKQMGMGKTMVCLSLVGLMLLHIQIATCCTHKEDDERFKTEAPPAEAPADSKMSSSSPININGVFFVEANPCYKEEGDDVYGADERRINTGANPLHNR